MSPAPVVLDAPTNLGLRAPKLGVVPGCYKLAGALRDHGLLARLGARDGGVVVPPRYDVGGWRAGDGIFNAAAVTSYTRSLADRVGRLLDDDGLLVVLGGDCSLLLGPALALRRRGRYGVVYLDAHPDFRHVGNSEAVGAAGGEALALITGRGQPDVADLDGRAPYVRDDDVAVLGLHEPGDPYLEEVRRTVGRVRTVREMQDTGCAATAREALGNLDADGLWVHLDVDCLDGKVMPAVDSPEPDGLSLAELTETLGILLADERVVGLDVAIFDPDLDPAGVLAGELTDVLVAAMAQAGRSG